MYRPTKEKTLDRSATIRDLREIVENYDPFLARDDANMNLLLDRMLASGKPWLLTAPNTVEPFLDSLPLAAGVEDALARGWQASDYARCSAYDTDVRDHFFAAGFQDFENAETYKTVINELGLANGWALNATGQQEQREQAAAARRQRLINIISDNGRKTQYPLFAKAYGCVRYYDCATLENETDETLESLATAVPQLRAQLAGRGTPKPQSPVVDDSLTSTVKPQSRLAETADEFLAHPSDPTREWTAQELKRASREQINALMFSHGQTRGVARQAAITRILQGRKFGE